MQKILLLSLIFAFSGCSFIHYLSILDQKKEEQEEYNSFLTEMGVSTNYSYQIKFSYRDSLSKSKKYCLNLYKYKTGTNASPVQIRMYNKEGDLLMGWENCYGELKQFNLFDSIPLKRINYLPNNYELKLQSDLNLIETNNNDEVGLSNFIQNHQYVIILFYSKWAGWYSKDAIKRVTQYVKNNKNIALIYLNTAC